MQLVCPGVVIDAHKKTCMPNHVADLPDVEDKTLHYIYKQRQPPLLSYAPDFFKLLKRRPPLTGKHVFRIFGFVCEGRSSPGSERSLMERACAEREEGA